MKKIGYQTKFNHLEGTGYTHLQIGKRRVARRLPCGLHYVHQRKHCASVLMLRNIFFCDVMVAVETPYY